MVVLSEVLPRCPPSSSSTHDSDVFLSFRGADTRYSFTDHLYNALLQADINTFLDDEEIVTGEPLKPELESAIKSSRASVIVLSKNYASSTWCLDELVLILEQQQKFNQIVIPIFYDVEPTDVRKQQSSFGEAMKKHKERIEAETDAEKRSELSRKMELWKMALEQVAGLKGEVAKRRKETEFIEEVVTKIQCRLGVSLRNIIPFLTGRYFDIEFITSWLKDESCHTTDILTVVGMSGIGKTSLAKYVFRLHSTKFHHSSFIEGINKTCNERFSGLLDLQKQLYQDITEKTRLQVNDVYVYTSKIENELASKRVFIVLDDIGSPHQLNALLGNKDLHPGSKIIITTDDASFTEKCALFNPQVQPRNKKLSLNGLYESASLELLCIHAFKSHKPKEGYEEVSEKLVKYCDGHPLALQVLGISLQNQDIAYWEDCIKVMKKEPHSHINTSFKMSFEALPFENDKELFKHISCFFVGINRDVAETILNACDVYTKSGIKNLTDKCLLSIGCNNELMMHSLIQDMGRDLVRQESPNRPGERSRVWCHDESFKVLEQNEGTENLIGIAFDMRMLEKEKLSGSLQLKTDALSKMTHLKLLRLDYVKINGSYKNISKDLRWLCMRGFPLKSLHLDIPMEKLVVLDMSHSNVESFDMSYSFSQRTVSRLKWLIGSSSQDKPVLGSLKILDLSFCEHLHNIGGFGELPALERLIVRNCIILTEVCESIEQCVKLIHIDLSYCCKLKNVPASIGKLQKVKTLLLDGCTPHVSQVEMWDMNSSDIIINKAKPSSAIPRDFMFLTFSLPNSLIRLSLANNNMSNKSFPMDFSCLTVLKELRLDNNPIVSMPFCVTTLPSLETLFMSGCKRLISVEHLPLTLTTLLVDVKDSSLRKIKFDTQMSPLYLDGVWKSQGSPFEIDGMLKIEAMAGTEENILQSLGWKNLQLIEENRMETSIYGEKLTKCQTQIYYQYGIFSTIYFEEEMPEWICCRSKGSLISFTIPSSSHNLQGLNFCYTEFNPSCYFFLPLIKISNVSKHRTWIYEHYIDAVAPWGSGCLLIFLSHWMFGPQEMKAGDHVTIEVKQRRSSNTNTTECGISLVYDDDDDGNIEEEDEDVLGYYKSWNYIIGGDLSHFQLTTGEYLLSKDTFQQFSHRSSPFDYPFIDSNSTKYKGRWDFYF